MISFRLEAQFTCSIITRNILCVSIAFRSGLDRFQRNQHLLFLQITCLAFPNLSFASFFERRAVSVTSATRFM
jgi:hypothetical protein